MEEGSLSAEFTPYLQDKKFPWFVDEFKKDLLSFEKAKEWADLIKSLQKLSRVRTPVPLNLTISKVLSKYPQFPVVPEKLIFCKRLAQVH
jgi:hypothetical protein